MAHRYFKRQETRPIPNRVQAKFCRGESMNRPKS